MAVVLTTGTQRRNGGVFSSTEDLTVSTATAAQSVSVTTDISTISGGTATGFGVDRYLLAAGSEGQYKSVVMLATGEAKMDTAGGTATGSFVFSAAEDIWMGQYINAGWKLIQTSATLATATNS